jgi:diguanylate cyclase (GGDEF)-like protein/PAS domain S-box-containing protein
VIAYMVDLLMVLEPDGTILSGTSDDEDSPGILPHEWIGRSWLEFVHPDDLEATRQALTNIIQPDAGSSILDLRLRQDDESWRWFETRFSNLLKDPNIRGILVSSRDITARKDLEVSTAERAESFSTLFHATAEAMIIHDGHRFVAVNQAYATLLGLEPAQVIGRSLFDFVAPASHALVQTQLGTRPEVPYEINALRADGTTFPIELLGRPIQYEGRALRLLTVRDVTARHQAENAIRASEARFRALVQDASDIVMVFDATGRVVFASPALERVLGHPLEVYGGAMCADLMHPADQDMIARVWTSVVKTPNNRVRATYRTINADRTWVWIEGMFTNLLDDPAVAGVVLNARDVTEQKRLEGELRHLAVHDALTDLPNRTLLADRLDQALVHATQRGEMVAVLFIDIDHFKQINDAFGHAAGDALLHTVARRLSSCVDVSHTLARVSGDEFVILMSTIDREQEAWDLAGRLQSVMELPFHWLGQDAFIGISIGIAISRSGEEASDVLLRNSDAALYSAKRAGRGRTMRFDVGMNGNAVRHWTLKTDLHGAAERGEFVLHYQPIMNLATGRLDQVEALIRWHHPRHGVISADDFIPVAEESAQIGGIGRWVLREVCRQLAAWGNDAPAIAVNLSASQFNDPDLVRDIASYCRETGVEPQNLLMEITEHVLIEHLPATASTLDQLHQLGVAVAIDDFGTGYSSLRYLRDLPIDAIKLDRSFVHGLESDPGALAIVEGITSLAHAIGLSVTAEGIETTEQLTRLREVGCDRGQGYFLARPAPAENRPPDFISPYGTKSNLDEPA